MHERRQGRDGADRRVLPIRWGTCRPWRRGTGGFSRDLIKEPCALLIFGDKRKSDLNFNCGACGYRTCAELNKAEEMESLTARRAELPVQEHQPEHRGERGRVHGLAAGPALPGLQHPGDGGLRAPDHPGRGRGGQRVRQRGEGRSVSSTGTSSGPRSTGTRPSRRSSRPSPAASSARVE